MASRTFKDLFQFDIFIFAQSAPLSPSLIKHCANISLFKIDYLWKCKDPVNMQRWSALSFHLHCYSALFCHKICDIIASYFYIATTWLLMLLFFVSTTTPILFNLQCQVLYRHSPPCVVGLVSIIASVKLWITLLPTKMQFRPATWYPPKHLETTFTEQCHFHQLPLSRLRPLLQAQSFHATPTRRTWTRRLWISLHLPRRIYGQTESLRADLFQYQTLYHIIQIHHHSQLSSALQLLLPPHPPSVLLCSILCQSSNYDPPNGSRCSFSISTWSWFHKQYPVRNNFFFFCMWMLSET